MRNVNYVDLAFIMEKVKEEELPNVNTKEMQVKEWVYEALRKLGSALVYEAAEIVVEVDTANKRVRIPNGLNYLISIRDENFNDMVEVKTSFHDQLSNLPAYFIRGRHIYLNSDTKTLNVEALQIPADDNGDPMIIDNPYVISAVVAYVAFRVGKRLWMTKRLSDSRFDYLETEWLFYVTAAGTSLETPSFDELKDWDMLNIGFPLSKLATQSTVSGAGKYVSPTTT